MSTTQLFTFHCGLITQLGIPGHLGLLAQCQQISLGFTTGLCTFNYMETLPWSVCSLRVCLSKAHLAVPPWEPPAVSEQPQGSLSWPHGGLEANGPQNIPQHGERSPQSGWTEKQTVLQGRRGAHLPGLLLGVGFL